jgi:hypothetical protein
MKTLEEFRLRAGAADPAAKIRELAEGGYIERSEPVVLIDELFPASPRPHRSDEFAAGYSLAVRSVSIFRPPEVICQPFPSGKYQNWTRRPGQGKISTSGVGQIRVSKWALPEYQTEFPNWLTDPDELEVNLIIEARNAHHTDNFEGLRLLQCAYLVPGNPSASISQHCPRGRNSQTNPTRVFGMFLSPGCRMHLCGQRNGGSAGELT